MEDDDGGLFNIEIDSSSDSSPEEAKVPRDFQSEEDFQEVKRTWKAKVETGDIWKSLNLPIDNPSKPQAETILHAIEELYFLRNFGKARKVAMEALKGKLSIALKAVVEDYVARCDNKLKSTKEKLNE